MFSRVAYTFTNNISQNQQAVINFLFQLRSFSFFHISVLELNKSIDAALLNI